MNRVILAVGAAGVLALSAPLAPALANDGHGRDHAEHREVHEDQADEHGRAHEEGFESRREHRGYHRALRGQHEEFHDDHPNTRHDHRRWWWR